MRPQALVSDSFVSGYDTMSKGEGGDKYAGSTTFGTDVRGDSFQVPSGMQIHNPYAIQPGSLPGNFQLSAPPQMNQLEYLYEDSDKKQRSMTSRLIYGAGVGWFMGAGVGSGHGLAEGGRAVMKDAQASTKIKLNTILNGVTKRGTAYSNTWGMLGMTYGVVNSGFIQLRGGSNDAVNAVGAGTVTGLIYGVFNTVPPSPRGIAVSTAMGASVAFVGSVVVAFLDGEVNPVRTVQDAFQGFSSGVSKMD